MRILLDVGSNIGQTIDVVLEKRFKLDKIIGFEPSPICLKMLRRKYVKKTHIEIAPFGLSSETQTLKLFNEGSQGGTVLDDYNTTCNPEHRVTECPFIKASTWFQDNVSEGDIIFLKMNCEGSECDIVNDLLDGQQWGKVHQAFIDFDVRKSPQRAHQERELLARLEREGYNNLNTFMGPTRHQVLFKELMREL